MVMNNLANAPCRMLARWTQWIVVGMVGSWVCGVLAAEFPAKPIRLIVPFSIDGGASMQAQVLVDPLRRNLRQQVLVEHRVGAGGLVGGEVVAKSPADGHTLLFTTTSLAVNASWPDAQIPFNALADLASVSLVSSAPLVLAVHPAVPAKSVPELVALARRARPAVRAGGNAPGSLSHVALALFSHAADVRAEIALFNGGGPAAKALAAGEIDMLFAAAPVVVSHLAAQRLRPLAVTAAAPQALFADVPALQRFYPGLVLENGYVLMAPALTPPSTIARLHAEVRRALVDDDVREFFLRHGLSPVASTPAASAAMLKQDIDRLAGQIRRGELRLQ